MSMFSKSAAVCPHCLRELTLSGMKFFCVPDEDDRHEVKLSFTDKFKGRLPVCRRRFCKNHGLTIREAVCKACGERGGRVRRGQIKLYDDIIARAKIFGLAVGIAGNGRGDNATRSTQ